MLGLGHIILIIILKTASTNHKLNSIKPPNQSSQTIVVPNKSHPKLRLFQTIWKVPNNLSGPKTFESSLNTWVVHNYIYNPKKSPIKELYQTKKSSQTNFIIQLNFPKKIVPKYETFKTKYFSKPRINLVKFFF